MPAHAQWLVEGCPEKTVARVKELAVDENGKVRKLGEIAAKIGTSDKSLTDWLYRRGHSAQSLLPDDKYVGQPDWLVGGNEEATVSYLRVMAVRRDGSVRTYKQLADLLGINHHTLRNWLKGRGLTKTILAEGGE